MQDAHGRLIHLVVLRHLHGLNQVEEHVSPFRAFNHFNERDVLTAVAVSLISIGLFVVVLHDSARAHQI